MNVNIKIYLFIHQKMKSKKSEQKEVKNKKIQKEKGIKEIENDILSSPKNINLFNKLIEIFINNIENKDEEKMREIMNSLKNILTYFLKNENVKSSNELITFLNENDAYLDCEYTDDDVELLKNTLAEIDENSIENGFWADELTNLMDSIES